MFLPYVPHSLGSPGQRMHNRSLEGSATSASRPLYSHREVSWIPRTLSSKTTWITSVEITENFVSSFVSLLSLRLLRWDLTSGQGQIQEHLGHLFQGLRCNFFELIPPSLGLQKTPR